MRQNKTYLLFLLLCYSAAIAVTACHAPAARARRPFVHMAEARFPNGSILYADRVPNSTMIGSDKHDSLSTEFCCYRIGFRDSILYDQKQEEAWGKYFNYRMEKDWVALVQGDSVHTVFFQPAITGKKQVYEGVLVFEVPIGFHCDSLVYTTSYTSAGRQLLVLNSPK